jgi:hypothetical protein
MSISTGCAGLPAAWALALCSAPSGCARRASSRRPEGLFYTPNAHLGIALSLLFVGRILYRLFEVYLIAPGMPNEVGDFARSPLTLAVFGLLAGYYIRYAVGLVRWRFRCSAGEEGARSVGARCLDLPRQITHAR